MIKYNGKHSKKNKEKKKIENISKKRKPTTQSFLFSFIFLEFTSTSFYMILLFLLFFFFVFLCILFFLIFFHHVLNSSGRTAGIQTLFKTKNWTSLSYFVVTSKPWFFYALNFIYNANNFWLMTCLINNRNLICLLFTERQDSIVLVELSMFTDKRN